MKAGRMVDSPGHALVREVAAIVGAIVHELQRLNRGGDPSAAPISGPRRKRILEFKAALAQRYHEDNRCC